MSHPERKPYTSLKLDFVSHLICNYHNMLLSQYDITMKQAKVLSYLMHHQGEDILQKNIEEVFFLRSSTVTSIMQNLEKAGFIERYQNKTDRRMKRILITPKGYEAFDHCEKTAQEVNEFILEEWKREDVQAMNQYLDQIIEKLKPTRH